MKPKLSSEIIVTKSWVEIPVEPELIECPNCNNEVNSDALNTVGNNKLCVDCCWECGVCNDYYNNDTSPHEYYNASYQRSSQVAECCKSCLESMNKCTDCEEIFSKDLHDTNTYGDSICETCAESYGCCEHCDTMFSYDNGRECSCGDDEENDDELYEYDYKPSPVFYGNPPKMHQKDSGVYFGPELEVEVIRGSVYDSVQKTKEALGDFAYCKHDGSLDNGYEIVTHPASLDYHKMMWEKFFAKDNEELRSFNTSTCGFHVHISRAPLIGLTIPKMVAFVNNPENYTYIKKLAQRFNNCNAVIKNIKIEDFKKTRQRTAINKCDYNGFDRYDAINITNLNTIELRIFKGTLKKETIFRYLEFCDALVRFCYPASRMIKEASSYKEFVKFVGSTTRQTKVPKPKNKGAKTGKKIDAPPNTVLAWPNLVDFHTKNIEEIDKAPVMKVDTNRMNIDEIYPQDDPDNF